MVAEISLLLSVWTLPFAVTLACTSSRPTTAVSTGVGLGPRRAAMKAPAATTTTTAASSSDFFLRFIRLLEWSHDPLRTEYVGPGGEFPGARGSSGAGGGVFKKTAAAPGGGVPGAAAGTDSVFDLDLAREDGAVRL